MSWCPNPGSALVQTGYCTVSEVLLLLGAAEIHCWRDEIPTLFFVGPEQIVLAAACLGMLTLGMNGTAIMAALPTMRSRTRAERHAESNGRSMPISSFPRPASFPAARPCDQFGARRVVDGRPGAVRGRIGRRGNGAGPAFLLAGRALQGLAAALAVPGTLAAISEASYAGTPRIDDRRLGRLPDAGLQPGSADRRRAHPLPRTGA